MAAVLEYLCAEVIDIAGIEATKAKKQRITPRHLMLAVKKDAELSELLKDVTMSESGVLPTVSVAKTAETVESQEF